MSQKYDSTIYYFLCYFLNLWKKNLLLPQASKESIQNMWLH